MTKGIDCGSCHSKMQDMALTEKARMLTVGFCLDCHRDQGLNLRPPEAIFNMDWHRAADTPSPAMLIQQYHADVVSAPSSALTSGA